MLRIPDWLFRPIARIYMDQRKIRRAETARRAAAHDAQLRTWARRQETNHIAGRCDGGKQCPFHQMPSPYHW